MFSPRWRKVLRDLWVSKTRTLLVVLSIAVGVFAVGTVSQTFETVQQELTNLIPLSNPASVTFATSAFDDTLLQTVRHVPGVEYAEGRTTIAAQIHVGDQWKTILLFALPDYNNIHINKVLPVYEPYGSIEDFGAERTTWPPPERELLFERASLLLPGLIPDNVHVGDSVEIKTTDDRFHSMRIAGLAREPFRVPATFAGVAYAYISMDTLEWLTGDRWMDQLDITVSENKLDRQHITNVGVEVRNKIESSGRIVGIMQVAQPGRHPLQDIFQGLLILLNALGFLAVFLSIFLVINTINALLAQQVRQIGIMKAIGARGGQIILLYLVLALIYGVLAFVVAVPLSLYVSRQTIGYLAGFVNADMPQFQIMPDVLITEAIIALLVPLLAALYPVIAGTRITVREAISDYGLGKGNFKRNWLDRLFDRLKMISRPLLLSFRNTFRRRSRLALTLTTLILAGTIFMAVFGVRGAMLQTLEDVIRYLQSDIIMNLSRDYRVDSVEQLAYQVPGVVRVESWGGAVTRRIRPDETESETIQIFAPRADTKMIDPFMLDGRWLLNADENAVVVSNGIVRDEPDLKVGDKVKFKIGTDEREFIIVGIVRIVGSLGAGGDRVAYVNYPYLSKITGQVGRTSALFIETSQHDSAFQDEVEKALQEHFKAGGVRTGTTQTLGRIRQQNELFFNIILAMLMVMAVLMAFVGGLGLMGTMSLNVLERTREIGVIRAIGANDGAVQGLVMSEGIFIGVLSWVISALLSIPLGKALSDAVGAAVFRLPLNYQVMPDGMVMWLIVVLVLSVLASYLPARRASKLTVREVLVYE